MLAMKTFSNYISITLTANTPTLVLFITFFNIDVCKSCSTISAEGNKTLLSIKQILYLKKDFLFIFTIKILCFIMHRKWSLVYICIKLLSIFEVNQQHTYSHLFSLCSSVAQHKHKLKVILFVRSWQFNSTLSLQSATQDCYHHM